MKIIKEIRDEDIGQISRKVDNWRIRNAARAIILDKNNNIAILNVTKERYHKLPGGKIENRENVLQALKREIKEETGCDIKIINKIGKIIEYKSSYGEKQKSYCYLTKVTKIGNLNLTKEEKNKGFILKWDNIDNLIKLIRNDSPKDYTSKFIRLRDFSFLLKAKEILSN
jgi:8-oxo-dGTP pyrophosphatase MutT (NUDIX family)